MAHFPIVGDQLGRPEGIKRSTSAVVVGTLTALYGVLGLGQAAHTAVNATWAIPRSNRLNPVVSRPRCPEAGQMNAVFAVVLGLVALLYIASLIAMLGLEINVVLAKRLYPAR